MKTTAASIVAVAAIPLLASVGIATADTSTITKTNDNNHRALSSRHWATLIPPSRVAALLLDDAHIHAPPSSSSNDNNNNHASSTAESLIDVPSNPNPASPHSISTQLETAHDDAVSAAIQAGASISQIEKLAYGGGVVSAATILDASAGPGDDSYHPANRLSNPALEYSPHIFDLAPSRTQPWITPEELDKFVGGAQNLRPDIDEWLDVVLPETVEDAIDGEGGGGQDDSDQLTLDEILHSNPGFSGFTNPIAPVNTNTNANSNSINQGAPAVTGGYTIDPVTGVYLDANGMVIADPSSFGIANTNVNPVYQNPATPAVSSTAASVGSIIFPSPTGGAATTTGTVSTASNLADLKNPPPNRPSSYPDPAIQGGVQLQYTNILPYPLSLPWYPRDGRPWVDPADLPAISGKAPVLDAINAASSAEVKRFIRNAYWDTGYWTEENFFGYGPPCSVAEVVAYNERMRAQGRLDADSAVQMTGRVGKNGKINGGPFIPGLHVVSADVALGSLGRCEGDCDDGELFDVRDEFNSVLRLGSGARVRGVFTHISQHIRIYH